MPNSDQRRPEDANNAETAQQLEQPKEADEVETTEGNRQDCQNS